MIPIDQLHNLTEDDIKALSLRYNAGNRRLLSEERTKLEIGEEQCRKQEK